MNESRGSNGVDVNTFIAAARRHLMRAHDLMDSPESRDLVALELEHARAARNAARLARSRNENG